MISFYTLIILKWSVRVEIEQGHSLTHSFPFGKFEHNDSFVCSSSSSSSFFLFSSCYLVEQEIYEKKKKKAKTKQKKNRLSRLLMLLLSSLLLWNNRHWSIMMMMMEEKLKKTEKIAKWFGQKIWFLFCWQKINKRLILWWSWRNWSTNKSGKRIDEKKMSLI